MREIVQAEYRALVEFGRSQDADAGGRGPERHPGEHLHVQPEPLGDDVNYRPPVDHKHQHRITVPGKALHETGHPHVELSPGLGAGVALPVDQWLRGLPEVVARLFPGPPCRDAVVQLPELLGGNRLQPELAADDLSRPHSQVPESSRRVSRQTPI